MERITAVLQGVKSNYETDLLRGIISNVEEIAGKRYGDDAQSDVSMRVIADHARAVTFLISDGVFPSNEGRGYVLRRILRRAVRHAKMLGIEEPCLYRITGRVRDIMRGAYPELDERIGFVAEVVKNEEERFFETIDRGLDLLNAEIAKMGGRRSFPGTWSSSSTTRSASRWTSLRTSRASAGFRSIKPGSKRRWRSRG